MEPVSRVKATKRSKWAKKTVFYKSSGLSYKFCRGQIRVLVSPESLILPFSLLGPLHWVTPSPFKHSSPAYLEQLGHPKYDSHGNKLYLLCLSVPRNVDTLSLMGETEAEKGVK